MVWIINSLKMSDEGIEELEKGKGQLWEEKYKKIPKIKPIKWKEQAVLWKNLNIETEAKSETNSNDIQKTESEIKDGAESLLKNEYIEALKRINNDFKKYKEKIENITLENKDIIVLEGEIEAKIELFKIAVNIVLKKLKNHLEPKDYERFTKFIERKYFKELKNLENIIKSKKKNPVTLK